MKKIISAVLLWLIVLTLVNAVSTKLIFDKTSYELPKSVSLEFRHVFVPWLNFDGRNYLKIILDGYDPSFYLNLKVFFPAYPLLVRALSLNLLINPILVGLSLSVFFFAASLFMTDKILALDKINQEVRHRVILLILCFPTSFYFIAFYTESLFLFLAVSFFYFLKKRNLALASLFVAMATATRITGLALLLPLLWETYVSYKESKKISWWFIFAPAGIIGYSAYLYSLTGNFFAFMTGQQNWNRTIGILSPFRAFSEGLTNALLGSRITQHDFIGRSMEVLEFLFAVLFVVLLIASVRKIKLSYWLYSLGCAIPVFFSGILSSVHRYMIVVFPLFFFVTQVLPKKYFYVVLAISSVLLLYLSSLFLRGYWVA